MIRMPGKMIGISEGQAWIGNTISGASHLFLSAQGVVYILRRNRKANVIASGSDVWRFEPQTIGEDSPPLSINEEYAIVIFEWQRRNSWVNSAGVTYTIHYSVHRTHMQSSELLE